MRQTLLVLLLLTVPALARQLPDTAVPDAYRIAMHPDLSHNRFSGEETVSLTVRQATRDIVLNALDLHVPTARIDGPAHAVGHPVIDARRQTLTVRFDQPLPPGHYALALTFNGVLRSVRQGFYVNRYPGGTMLATEMEPADARRAFPCWDEPEYRCRWTLSVTVPGDFLAVSNMPVAHQRPLANHAKQVDFQTTPPMASYLVALIAGPLETAERQVDGVTVRAVVRRGQKANTTYALDVMSHVLPFLHHYFNRAYPLPKIDMIGLPGGYGGAMENWGAITYDETLLLFNPKTGSPSTREDVFNTIAHETAHQWFGDLVTMQWWDDLWLNEGFATWMALKEEEAIEPGWAPWVGEQGESQTAMGTDGEPGAHPIQQAIHDPGEADSAFDDITYEKGASFIRMMESYLGPDVFRKGIQLYIQQHAFGNARTGDLWAALAQASGQPVAEVAKGWTEQPGYPVVSIDGSKLHQQRFSPTSQALPAETWDIPIAFVPHGKLLLTSSDGEAPAAGLKLNPAGRGYYRVRYADYRSVPVASVQDGANLLNDAWALMLAGQVPPEQAVAVWDKTPPGLAWGQVLSNLSLIDGLYEGQPEQAVFRAWALPRLEAALATVGWEPRLDEPPATSDLRGRLIALAGDFGSETVRQEAEKRFGDVAHLSPSLRSPVLHVVGRYADQATWNKLLGLARQARSQEEQVDYCAALAASQDEKLAAQTLELSLQSDFPPQMAVRLVHLVADNEHQQMAWDFAVAHQARLLSRLAVFNQVTYMPRLAMGFTDRSDEATVRQNAPLKGADNHQDVQHALDIIERHAWIKINVLPVLDRSVLRQGHAPRL
ncbi:MAG TPA: M1 family metallopeptidase [Candidatus Xenobia bacterium]|jgi:aminopeptidase N